MKNYLRSHRYLRELVVVVIFNIFFSGFLYSPNPEAEVWAVFGVFTILLAMVTVPSVFLLEKGNARAFLLVRPRGRLYFLLAKMLQAVVIDFVVLATFSLLYGIRYAELGYFAALPLRWLALLLILLLTVSILTLTFTCRSWMSMVALLWIVFGSILNKAALFPPAGFSELYKIIAFLLPPNLELIYSAIELKLFGWRLLFIISGLLQLVFLIWLNYRCFLKKDLV